MDRLQAMQTFAAIVHGGSLTAAAEALDCSLPTVVRVLATLEPHLGARLLRRTTRTMSLTGEGERYLRSCQRILADIDDAERDVLDAMQDPQGVIHMTAPVLFGQMHVAPLVCEFLSLYTKASINLTLLDRTIDLVDDGVDLALRIGPLRDSSMVALRRAHAPSGLCQPNLSRKRRHATQAKRLIDTPGGIVSSRHRAQRLAVHRCRPHACGAHARATYLQSRRGCRASMCG